MYECLRLYSHIQQRPERGPAANCSARQGRGGPLYLHGQGIRQGFQPASIQKAGKKTEAGRLALHSEHRPAGAQL